MKMSTAITALRLFVIMTVITGIIYPVAITAIGHVAFPRQTYGSIIKRDSTVIGSLLIAQPSPETGYFLPRPSACNYTVVPSAASNLAITSALLHDSLLQRAKKWGNSIDKIPSDLLFSSGSGLDPHTTPNAALFQVDRIARERNLSDRQIFKLKEIIAQKTEKPQWGIFGMSRINVLLLNVELQRALIFPGSGK